MVLIIERIITKVTTTISCLIKPGALRKALNTQEASLVSKTTYAICKIYVP
jgi:hypothetical protein